MASEKISQMPAVTSTSANDTYILVQGGVNSSISFTNLQSAIISGLASEAYTPANPTDWAGTPPTTIQQALDRLAAAVGSVTPIP